MSLSRRLRRLVRAQLGALRGDPLDDPTEAGPSSAGDASPETRAETSAADPAVPPDVAKAYRALEVPVGSDRETVKAGYRNMMNQYHQDRFQNDEERRPIAGEVSKRLNRAYDRVLEYLDERS